MLALWIYTFNSQTINRSLHLTNICFLKKTFTCFGSKCKYITITPNHWHPKNASWQRFLYFNIHSSFDVFFCFKLHACVLQSSSSSLLCSMCLFTLKGSGLPLIQTHSWLLEDEPCSFSTIAFFYTDIYSTLDTVKCCWKWKWDFPFLWLNRPLIHNICLPRVLTFSWFCHCPEVNQFYMLAL